MAYIYVLEREGRLRSVRAGPFTYYFVNPKAAAEVILSSVDPSNLTLEDKEKLDYSRRVRASTRTSPRLRTDSPDTARRAHGSPGRDFWAGSS